MRGPPTDLELLEHIYSRYYSTFCSFDRDQPTRAAKIFVPINIEAIAKNFDVDGDIVFGRLYYHLNKKYGYTEEDGTKVSLFVLSAGSDRHCIQFALLSSLVATLRDERNRYLVAIWLSTAALLISVLSLVISVVSRIK